METKLFREEVIEAGRERLTGAVVAATPPGSRLYTLLLAAVAAALILLLLWGQYASKVAVRGTVAHARGIARVYSPAVAEVREVHVAEGESVAAGAPLVTLSMTPGSSNAAGAGVARQLAEFGRQDDELARQQSLASSLGTAETSALERQKTSLAATIASLERQLSLGTSQIALAEADIGRAARLAKEGAGTQRQVEESRGALLSRRLELESVTERLIAQRETLRAIDGQVAARRIGASQSVSEIAARRAALAEQRAALSRQDRLVLTAPVAGTVGDIGARIGLRAQADASLVTVIPEGSRLEVQLWAPSRAIGFVRPGQEVRLLFDAFPYQKYGAGRGTVTAVAGVPTEPAALDPGLGITEPVFRIRVAIDPRGLSAGGLSGAAADRPLRAGMTLGANLLLERRSLWEVFFDPVLKAIRS